MTQDETLAVVAYCRHSETNPHWRDCRACPVEVGTSEIWNLEHGVNLPSTTSHEVIFFRDVFLGFLNFEVGISTQLKLRTKRNCAANVSSGSFSGQILSRMFPGPV